MTNMFMSDTIITSVVFSDETLEITIMESRDQSNAMGELRVVMIPFAQDQEKSDMVMMIQDLLREIVDRGYAERRAEQNGERKNAEMKREVASPRRLTELESADDDEM
jgi:hypothetical protein